MSGKMFFKLLAAMVLLLDTSCNKPVPVQPEPEPRPVLELNSVFLREYPGADGVIDNTAGTALITLPYGAFPGKAHIHYTVPDGITGSPKNGSEVDASRPIELFLVDKDGNARKYTVTVEVAKSSDATISGISNVEYLVEGEIDGDSIHFVFPNSADVTALTFNAAMADGATTEPSFDVALDLTEPKSVRVTAPDGTTTREYVLDARVLEQETAVRGVYLPAPSHTHSFGSYANAKSSMELLSELNFNCIFVCVWANSKIAWDSEVLLQNSTYASAREGNMYANYTGGSGDALKDMIELAHEHGIKVILWFEYGFMHKIGGVNLSDPIVAKHPGWLGKGSDGKWSNYNGTDYYLNAYDPEVQEFMLSLMEEALEKYPEVDGIQGDDRLPAMPRNSGYDDVTAALYKSATGLTPPANPNDSAWVQWRLSLLNGFAVDMYCRLKAKSPNLCVCFAPNKYPWCMNNLMQDWPQWIRDGAVDLLTVQCYVLPSYETDVTNSLKQVAAAGAGNILNPAMILKNGANIMSRDVLIQQLRFNRKAGTCGESQFWFDGLYTDYVRDVFRSFYPGKVRFPEY